MNLFLKNGMSLPKNPISQKAGKRGKIHGAVVGKRFMPQDSPINLLYLPLSPGDHPMGPSIHTSVANALTGLGYTVPSSMIQTMLIKEGHFAGFKFYHDQGYAILHEDGQQLECFDEEGNLLRTLALDAEQGAAA